MTNRLADVSPSYFAQMPLMSIHCIFQENRCMSMSMGTGVCAVYICVHVY